MRLKFLSPFSVILLTTFLDMLGMSLLIPLLPTIVRDFLTPTLISANGFTHGLVQLLSYVSPDPVALANGISFSIFSIGMFVGGLLFGRLSDKIGRKKTLVFTSGLGVLGYLLFGFSLSFLPFLIGRLLSGFAGAGGSVAQAYISDIFSPQERAAKMGMAGAAFGIAFAVGPLIWGAISHLGLQIVGFVSAAVMFVNLLLIVFVLPEPKHHMHEMDRADLPPVDFKKVLPIYIVSFLAMFGFSAMQSTFGMLVPDRFGKTAETVGYLMGVIGITSILYQGFGIKYVRKVLLEKGMILFGLAVMCISFALFAINPYFIGVPILEIFFPIGFWSLGVATSVILSKLAPGHAGKVLGANASAMSLASIFGPLIANALYGFVWVSGPSFARLIGFTPFMMGAILFLLSIPFAYFVIRDQKIWVPKKHS